MSCPYQNVCGGCALRQKSLEEYQAYKKQKFTQMLGQIRQTNISQGEAVFIGNGTRRRCSFAYNKGHFGFNAEQSHKIIDIENCANLTPKINENIVNFKKLADSLKLDRADIWVLDSDTGLDVVLEYKEGLNLERRMIIFEQAQEMKDISRISYRKSAEHEAEKIIEKQKIYINMSGINVQIPAATFLQPSKAGQQALEALVTKYAAGYSGKAADLFCGIGTFSYALCKGNKIIAADSSKVLLENFAENLKKNMLQNIEIKTQNLFKYPLEEADLENVGLVVLDPPRAGAKEQVTALAKMAHKIKQIIAVSCNLQSFVRDANILIGSGYKLTEVTMVDQFTYTEHFELVSNFIYEEK